MLTQREALEVLAAHRGDAVVVPTMGSVGLWPEFSDTPLDFHYLPSSMGQGVSLGLGLALAQPSRRVVVLSGDGSLLMNLGALVTVAQFEINLKIVLIDNGLYEVTGGQVFVGSRRIDFELLARGAGLTQVFRFADPSVWRVQAETVLLQPGPGLIWLEVEGEKGKKTPSAPRLMSEQIPRLRAALGIES